MPLPRVKKKDCHERKSCNNHRFQRSDPSKTYYYSSFETDLGYLRRSYQKFRRIQEQDRVWMENVWFPKEKKKQSWGFRADGDSEGFKRFHWFLRNMKPFSIHRILGPQFNSCSLFQFLSIIKLVVLVRLNTQL